MTVAILGAGIAGAAAARTLAEAGVDVVLFDKGRGAGGRMATRRVGDLRFDHGAQYVRARDGAFAALLARAQGAGAAAPWSAVSGAPQAMVGMPGMSALVRFLLAHLPVTTGFAATALERAADGWHLVAPVGRAGPFDAVIVTVPSVQAVPLLAPHHARFAEAARAARYAPCWTGMFAFAAPAELAALPHDAFAGDGIAWAAHDGGKPGRGGVETLVVQGGPEWSAAHLEEPAEAIGERLGAILAGRGLPEPTVALAHRWRYAMVIEAATLDLPYDDAARLGVAGDWLGGPRVEAAWLAGRQAAVTLLAAR